MAFYDNIKDKLSKTGQEAMQKTRNLTDTTKYTLENVELEKANTGLFKEIGRIYFEKYSDQLDDPDIQALIEKAQKNKAKIENNHKHIYLLKGTMPCPECGTEVRRGEAFCKSCGKPAPEWEEPRPESDFDEPITERVKDTFDAESECPICHVKLINDVCPLCGFAK